MTRNLDSRLRRIEAARNSTQRVVVVIGHSEAEREGKEAALIAAGAALASDLFVHIRKETRS